MLATTWHNKKRYSLSRRQRWKTCLKFRKSHQWISFTENIENLKTCHTHNHPIQLRKPHMNTKCVNLSPQLTRFESKVSKRRSNEGSKEIREALLVWKSVWDSSNFLVKLTHFSDISLQAYKAHLVNRHTSWMVLCIVILGDRFVTLERGTLGGAKIVKL